MVDQFEWIGYIFFIYEIFVWYSIDSILFNHSLFIKIFCCSLGCNEEQILYKMFMYFWMYFAKVLLKILIIFTSFLPHSKFFIRIGTLNKTNYSMDLFNTNWTSFILNSFRFTYQSNCQPCKWTIRIWSIWFKRIALDLTQMMPRECKNELC